MNFDPSFVVSVETSEIYGTTTVQRGGNCMNQRKGYGYVVRFKGGRTNGDDVRSGRPLTAT
jgi:hypothetical protein